MPKASLQVVQDLLRVILALSAFIVIAPLIIYDAIYQTTFPNTEKRGVEYQFSV